MLARVKSEAGPDARVLEAKKVRDGGLGGFFSKERFVLTVELPDAPTRRSRAPRSGPEPAPAPDPEVEAAPPSSILELADLMNEAEALETMIEPGIVRRHPVARHVEPEPVVWRSDLPVSEPLVPVERAPEPLPSTETPSFQSVLSRLAAEMPTPEEAQVAAPDLDTVTLGFEPFDVASDVETLNIEDFRDISDDVRSDEHIDAEASDQKVEAPVHPAISTPETSPAVPSEPTLVRARRAPTDIVRTAGTGLLELGVPAACIPNLDVAFARGDIREAIRTALRLPRPPALPLRNNSIIAVVGGLDDAVQLADQLADEPALNGAIVRVADGRTPISLGTAGLTRRRRRPNRTIVAVPSSGMPSGWARDMLEELQPDLVWGVVPASRKTEDIASWAVGLGGLDVLALTDLEDTVSPASALRLGIPVGMLDGTHATPAAWADLLTERLAA